MYSGYLRGADDLVGELVRERKSLLDVTQLHSAARVVVIIEIKTPDFTHKIARVAFYASHWYILSTETRSTQARVPRKRFYWDLLYHKGQSCYHRSQASHYL